MVNHLFLSEDINLDSSLLGIHPMYFPYEQLTITRSIGSVFLIPPFLPTFTSYPQIFPSRMRSDKIFLNLYSSKPDLARFSKISNISDLDIVSASLHFS